MGCCSSKKYTPDERTLELVLQAMEARRAADESRRPPPSEHLSLGTIQQGMGVRVTDSKSTLERACAESGLSCTSDRVLLMNEPGVVVAIDPSDSTAKIRWEGKEGFMPISSLVKSDVARTPLATSGHGAQSGPDAAGLVALLLAAGADAIDTPEKTFDAARGFHFHCDLKSIEVDASKKVATCQSDFKATVVTEELLAPDMSPCEFLVKVGCAKKGIVVGVTSKTPNGYSRNLIGDSNFEGTIGAVCTDKGSGVVHRSKQVAEAHAIDDGDVVGVRVNGGNLQFLVKGIAILDFQVSGPFRLGVSIFKEGQVAKILAAPGAPAAGGAPGAGEPGGLALRGCGGGGLQDFKLRVGGRVRLPPATDRRLKCMRVGWNPGMAPHCGEIGVVEAVSKRSAKVEVRGKSYHWDMEVFGSGNARFCHSGGCRLSRRQVGDKHHVCCDVCLCYQPAGSQTFRCEEHDYDVCEYCNGSPTLPPVDSTVIRGPSWKWGSQDGTPFSEGIVRAVEDGEECWVTVEFGQARNKYRGPPFQDVMLARGNGLRGKTPRQDGLHALRDITKALEERRDTSGDSAELPTVAYTTEQGWHFFDRLKSIAVDDTKKVAVCKTDRYATVVTEEIVVADGSSDDIFDFTVKICCAGDSSSGIAPLTLGVVDNNPTGFSSNTIGHASFKGIGAMCLSEAGAIVSEGKIVGDAPGAEDGDIFSVHVHGRDCQWVRNGVKFHSCQLRGKFRFGVSLVKRGQSVEIMNGLAARADALQGTLRVALASVPRLAWGTQLQVDTDDGGRRLGSGAFGETWRATLVAPAGSQDVAVKLLKPDGMTPELRRNFAEEVSALARLTLPGGETHPYLLQLIAIVPEKYGIVTELCICDLKGYLETRRGGIETHVAAKFMQQVAVGMAWLVERQYVHRDLKMQNILVASGDVAKIADFGLARPMAVRDRQAAGTILFMAPECFAGHFSERTDVYSFAFIMLSTFSGAEVSLEDFMTARHLVVALVSEEVLAVLADAVLAGARPEIPERTPGRVAELIKACWDGNPKQRPTFEGLSSDLRQFNAVAGAPSA